MFGFVRFRVPDAQLRNDLRSENIQHVVEQYKEFRKKYEDVDFTTDKGKYLKYDYETLKKMLNQFFEHGS